MQKKRLYKLLLGTEQQPNEPAPLANGVSIDENHKVLMDAYGEDVADIKEKRIIVCCHLSLTLDATTVMLMRHDCVGDDGIGDEAKAWKFMQEKFQSVDMPGAGSIAAWGVWRFRQLLNQRTGVAQKATRDRGSSQGDSLQRLGHRWSANEVWKFRYTGKLSPSNRFWRVGENAVKIWREYGTEKEGEKCIRSSSSEAWNGTQERKQLCVGSLDTLPRTAGGRQCAPANVARRVAYTRLAGDKEMEANMSQWWCVQHKLHQMRKNGRSLRNWR